MPCRSSRVRCASATLLLLGLALGRWACGPGTFVPLPAACRETAAEGETLRADGRRGVLGASFAACATCGYSPCPHDHANAFPFDDSSDIYVKFKVDMDGDRGGKEEVTVRLHPEWAPRGVKRFQDLVSIGQFEDAPFFHVDDDFAHFGLPAEPTLSPAAIKDDMPRTSNTRGTLTFAASGRHTRKEQLFFNTNDNKWLDKHGYAPIGEVVEGMDAIDRLYDGYRKRPERSEIVDKGNAYLDEYYPKLSKIDSVELL